MERTGARRRFDRRLDGGDGGHKVRAFEGQAKGGGGPNRNSADHERARNRSGLSTDMGDEFLENERLPQLAAIAAVEVEGPATARGYGHQVWEAPLRPTTDKLGLTGLEESGRPASPMKP